MPKFQRRHYEWLAEFLASIPSGITSIGQVEWALAQALSTDNPEFAPLLFHAAVAKHRNDALKPRHITRRRAA